MERRRSLRAVAVACAGLALAGCETLRRAKRAESPDAPTVLLGEPGAARDPAADPTSPAFYRRPSSSSRRGALSDTGAEIEKDLGVR